MFLKRFRRTRPVTDAEYVAAYRATGDLAVLGELYERHMELVYAVCYNYLRDEEEAKDAVMQLFEQLITDLRRFEVQKFQPWLHSVARNHCLKLLRQYQTHPRAVQLVDSATNDEEDTLTPLAGGIDALENAETQLDEDLTRLESCLQTLPTEQRACLSLFYLEQKSYAEVAAITQYDLKQVKSYLQNGRRMLKLCMQK